MQTNIENNETDSDTNNFLAVRCINPKNTGLKKDKVYKVTESEHFKYCYILDVGWNMILSKDMFEVIE